MVAVTKRPGHLPLGPVAKVQFPGARGSSRDHTKSLEVRPTTVRMLTSDAFPDDSFTRTITAEVEQLVLLVAVQALDGIAQTPLRILFRMRRQGIVDPRRPAFLREGGENGFLVDGRPLESFDDQPRDVKFTSLGIHMGPAPVPADPVRAGVGPGFDLVRSFSLPDAVAAESDDATPHSSVPRTQHPVAIACPSLNTQQVPLGKVKSPVGRKGAAVVTIHGDFALMLDQALAHQPAEIVGGKPKAVNSLISTANSRSSFRSSERRIGGPPTTRG